MIALSTSMVLAQEPSSKEKRRETDDPRARAQYLRDKLGAKDGIPPGARVNALREMDQMLEREGKLFREAYSANLQRSSAASGSSLSAAPPTNFSISPNASTWTPLGPAPTSTHFVGDYAHSSGRVTAVVVDSNDASGNTVYIGGAQGGVWKTTDGGTTWLPLTDNQPSLAIGSLAIDPTGVVYAGTGEENFSGDSYYGAGVLKLTNGGLNWTQLGAATFAGPLSPCPVLDSITCGGAFIGALAIRPQTTGPTQEILAAVDLNGAAGVYRSTNGGTNWAIAGGLPINVPATDVKFANNSIAYAGVASLGVFKSIDGGVSFTPMNGGTSSISTSGTDRVALAVVSDQIVYAAIATRGNTSALAGFYKTTDGGANWIKLGPNGSSNLPDFCTPQCFYDLIIAVNPADPRVVFVGGSATSDNSGTNNHILKSTDGGATWTPQAKIIHVDQHAAAFAANGKLYWGNDGGVYSTTNTAADSTPVTWTDLNNTLNITQFYPFFAIHPTDSQITFAGAQDNGTMKFSGTLAWDYVTCGDGASAVFDPNTPTTVYAGCQGVDVRKSSTGNFETFLGADFGITKENVGFIPPLVGDSSASGTLYFGTYHLWQTTDGAASWNAISGDLTSGHFSQENITAIAVGNPNTIYAVTSNGVVSRITPGGNCVANPAGCVITPPSNLPYPNLYINSVVATDAMTAYIAIAGFAASPNQKVYMTSNGGANWTNISGNLPNTPVNDLVVDPDIHDTIYAATDIGVFITQNGGANWSTLQTALPKVAVFGLKLHRPTRTLRAATHGRGMWDLYVPANLSGPNAVVSPGSIDFGSVNTGATTVTQTITVTNNGGTPMTIASINVTGEFQIAFNGCPGTLTTACTVSVNFHPIDAGIQTGFLTVASNAGNGTNSARVALSGIGFQIPVNDNFAKAKFINSGSYSDTVFITGATTESTDPFPDETCVGLGFSGSGRDHTVWYTYIPSTNGSATIDASASDYDTVVSVWTGNVARTFSPVACNDDIITGDIRQSRLTFPVSAGVGYRIMMAGYSSIDVGTLKFTFNGPAPLQPINTFNLSVTQVGRPGRGVRSSAANIITAGQSAAFIIHVAPTVPTQQTVTLSCAGAPVGTTCSVKPDEVTLGPPSDVTLWVRAPEPSGSRTTTAPSRSRRLGASAASQPVNYIVHVNAKTDEFVSGIDIPVQIMGSGSSKPGQSRRLR